MKAIILLAALSLLLVGCAEEYGTLALSLTDAPLENVEALEVTITDIAVHTAGGQMAETNTTAPLAGWNVISEETQTFDLIEIKDTTVPLGTSDLPIGKYTQVRLTVESATATIDGEEYDVNVPSGVIKLNHPFDILAGVTTSLTLDFDAEQSLTETGNGYNLKPTIKIVQE